MENFSQKWVIASLLEELKDGTQFNYTDFPLHLTLAGVFAVNLSGEQLAAGIKTILLKQKQLTIIAHKSALFGPNHDIKVMQVIKSPELMLLYLKIHNWLVKNKAIYNSPEYQGEGYSPHCTDQKSGSLKSGESSTITSVSLIDLYPNGDGYQRKIIKTINLINN